MAQQHLCHESKDPAAPGTCPALRPPQVLRAGVRRRRAGQRWRRLILVAGVPVALGDCFPGEDSPSSAEPPSAARQRDTSRLMRVAGLSALMAKDRRTREARTRYARGATGAVIMSISHLSLTLVCGATSARPPLPQPRRALIHTYTPTRTLPSPSRGSPPFPPRHVRAL